MPVHSGTPIKMMPPPKTPIGKVPSTMGQKKALVHLGVKSKRK